MIFVALCAGQWLATFDLGDLDGEVLDRMDAADEDVAQGLATRFGIVDRPQLQCSHRAEGTRPSRGRGPWPLGGRSAWTPPARGPGFCWKVPLDQSLVIATLSGVKDTSGIRCCHRRLIARYVFLIMTAPLAHGNDQGARLHCERSSWVLSPWPTRA